MGDLPDYQAAGAGPVEAIPHASQENDNSQAVKATAGGQSVGTVGAGESQQQDGHHQEAPLEQHLPTTHHALSTQFDMTDPSSAGRPGPYNMGNMANALPQSGYRHGQYQQGAPQHQYNIGPGASPSMGHHMSQLPQYASHQMPMGNQGYYVQQPSMNPYYGPGQFSPTHPSMPPRQNMSFYPNQMMMNTSQSAYYYPPTNQYNQPHAGPPGMMQGQYVPTSPPPIDTRALRAQTTGSTQYSPSPASHAGAGSERRQGAVRGPPRKPRQSGHAIWIGNLPPQTELMSLVHHVCKEAAGLESLFLISKSNCAFANFKDEATCAAAQQSLHDSRFQTVRLVSRLRKSTVEGATGIAAPTGPAASAPASTEHVEPSVAESAEVSSPASTKDDPKAQDVTSPRSDHQTSPPQDKFFVLKSLTIEDLELSVRTGIWATQSHNEVSLNKAFTAVDNVYLVFSANKSGEYFGYARMVSKINDDPAAAIEFAPKAQTTTDLDLPKAISTDPTEFAPKGRIIDDSARGTIFWEAEREGTEENADAESEDSGAEQEEETQKSWGKPFSLEWLSTTRLPFYRTRGLRNPWNSNREVKIARDGTELEPSVGRRLIGLFNRVQSPVMIPAALRQPIGMAPGFSPMRPYGQ